MFYFKQLKKLVFEILIRFALEYQSICYIKAYVYFKIPFNFDKFSSSSFY